MLIFLCFTLCILFWSSFSENPLFSLLNNIKRINYELYELYDFIFPFLYLCVIPWTLSVLFNTVLHEVLQESSHTISVLVSFLRIYRPDWLYNLAIQCVEEDSIEIGSNINWMNPSLQNKTFHTQNKVTFLKHDWEVQQRT